MSNKANGSLVLRDNMGKTLDRYTLIVTENHISYFYSFGGYVEGGEEANYYNGCTADGLEDGAHLGRIISFNTLSPQLQSAMFARYNERRDQVVRDLKLKIEEYENSPKNTKNREDRQKYDDLIDALEEFLKK